MGINRDYQDRIEVLEAEVARLKDLLMTVVGSVEYRKNKPFDALLSQLMIFGEKRIELLLILNGILNRLNGRQHLSKPEALFKENSYLIQAYSDEPIDELQAVALLNELVGVANGELMLQAFIRQYQNS